MKFKITKTIISGCIIIEPEVFEDERGYFMETYRDEQFLGTQYYNKWVQENESESLYGTIRGLHYQKFPYEQAKLLRVQHGIIRDVVVDLRFNSETYGKHIEVELSGENRKQILIPVGCAHGFSVLSGKARVQYKCSQYYKPEEEGGIIWNDKRLGIDWMIPDGHVIISEKDKNWESLHDFMSRSDEQLKKIESMRHPPLKW